MKFGPVATLDQAHLAVPVDRGICLVIQLVFRLLTIFLYLYPPADSPRRLLAFFYILSSAPGRFLLHNPWTSIFISISIPTYSIAHVDRGQGTLHTLRLLIPPALRSTVPPSHPQPWPTRASFLLLPSMPRTTGREPRQTTLPLLQTSWAETQVCCDGRHARVSFSNSRDSRGGKPEQMVSGR